MKDSQHVFQTCVFLYVYFSHFAFISWTAVRVWTHHTPDVDGRTRRQFLPFMKYGFDHSDSRRTHIPSSLLCVVCSFLGLDRVRGPFCCSDSNYKQHSGLRPHALHFSQHRGINAVSIRAAVAVSRAESVTRQAFNAEWSCEERQPTASWFNPPFQPVLTQDPLMQL